MRIRPTRPEELDEAMAIYAHAREFMAAHGNPNQWGPNQWPPRELIAADIAAGKHYACVADAPSADDASADARIAAVFYYDFGDDIDPTYRVIDGAGWLSDTPYGVVHRIASDGIARGAGTACLEWAYAQAGHVRIDTHEDNVVLQGLLGKLGYSQRGIIYLENGDPRLAYEKV